MKHYSRRQFLKLGAAAVTAACLGNLTVAQSEGFRPIPEPTVDSTDSISIQVTRGGISGCDLTFRASELQMAGSFGLAVVDGRLTPTSYRPGVYTSPAIEAPMAFSAVGPQWAGEMPPGSEIALQIRTRSEGGDWGPWQATTVEEPTGETPTGRYFGSLVPGPVDGHLGRYVQYRVWMTPNGFGSGSMPYLDSVTLTLIDASDGPTTEDILGEQVLSLADSISEQSVLARPPVVSRTSWGCPEGQNSPAWTPRYRVAYHAVVHHTASSNAIIDWAAHVRAIWYYHAITLDWGDIGYNYLVDPNGLIYEGRAGGDDVIAAHAFGFNAGTMGVGCLGTYSAVGVSTSLRTSLESLLAWKCNQRGLDPLGSRLITGYESCEALTINHPTISGHRSLPGHNPAYPYACAVYGPTTCPGDSLQNSLPTIRSNVAVRLQGGATTTSTIYLPLIRSN